VLVNLVVLSLLIYHVLNRGNIPLFFAVPYALFVIFLATRARRLRSRVAELADLAAYRIGLLAVSARQKSGETPSPRVIPSATA